MAIACKRLISGVNEGSACCVSPLLLLVPAFFIDVVLRRTEGRGVWLRAALLGVTFVVTFAAVQWPFADFLVSDASRNALFRTDNFPYMMSSDWPLVKGELFTQTTGETVRGFGFALLIGVLSARLGLARGDWLRSVRR